MSQPLLSASQIFDAVDLKEDVVDVTEWGGKIRLVQLTAAESMQLTRDMDTKENVGNGMYLMLVYSARNEQNERLFTLDDVEKLKLKNFNVLNMLQNRALRLNAMTVPEREALKKD
jgi:hypothetical protein